LLRGTRELEARARLPLAGLGTRAGFDERNEERNFDERNDDWAGLGARGFGGFRE